MNIGSEAREELAEACAWYEAQRTGLGNELLDEVDRMLAKIETSPESFAVDRFDRRARRAVMNRFPYAIIFVFEHGTLNVIAFAHAKRRPSCWRDRR